MAVLVELEEAVSPYMQYVNYLTGQWWYWVGMGVVVVAFFLVMIRRRP